VLFLQHGAGQTWSDWVDVGFAAQILDNHYLRGDIAPMVVVMANGNSVGNFNNELTQRLIPTTMANYNVSSQPGERAIAGLSMGSGLALGALYNIPGTFAYVGGFSAFTSPPANANVANINNGTKLVALYDGDIQDFVYGQFVSMVNAMNTRGINHEPPVIYAGPHSWDVWQKSLIDFLPKIFTDQRPVFAAGGATQTGSEGSLLTFSVGATDPEAQPLTYSATGLPSGATVDAATGQFSWTPSFSQAGTYSVVVKATDGTKSYSLSETKTVSITIGETVQVSATASIRCTAGKAYVLVTTANSEGAPVDIAITSAYGTKSFSAVATGKAVSQSFTTRLASVPAGTVTVDATATLNGTPVTTHLTASYPATVCGS
jgi:hypothetical protein